jgi:large subunit ribosomal protein L25
MQAKLLNAELKNETGKNANNRLRAAGFIPAVLYSHGESEQIKINEKEFFNLFKGHISESVIFSLNIPNKKDSADLMAYIKDYQLDPVTEKVVHLDLFKVTSTEKIKTRVPLEIIGTPKGIKQGGFLEVYAHEIEVECLPKDLPEKVVVDVTELELDKNIHAKALNLAAGVVLTSNVELVIAAVHSPRVEKEAAAVAETESAEVAEAKTEE